MIAAFWWEQPGWLVLLLALGAGWVALRRSGAAERASGTDAPRRAGTRRRLRRLLAAGAAAGVAALVGWWLLRAGTSGGLVLLGALGGGGMAALTFAAYGRQRAGLSTLGRIGLTALRLAASTLLLVLVARPVWDWEVVEWRKPLLVALLDQSESMSLADGSADRAGRTRAARANAVLNGARRLLARLERAYDVRLWGVGEGHEPLTTWRIDPQMPLTGLVLALRDAGRMRTPEGAPPATVIVISDGAENIEAPRALRPAAEALARQGTALVAAGVGPVPGETPLAELDPLALPAQLSVRDRLRVPIRGRVQGCGGAEVQVELWWDAECVATRTVSVARSVERFGCELDLVPAAAGVHRVTARVVLPQRLGGHAFEACAIVNVRDDQIRVVQVEDTPRTEAAFVARALAGDPQIELTRRFLFAEEDADSAASLGTLVWSDYDVVILGRIREKLSDDLLAALARAVSEDGVAVLLAGGRALFNDRDYGDSPLAVLSPVGLVRDEFGLAGPVSFVPTAAGSRHPILRTEPAPGTATAPAAWAALPPLGEAALLGRVKPLATVLATDDAGRPLLAVHEVGRGRCAAAAWTSTWVWALASDEGTILHRRLWRQLVLWLANRRPRAWVLTDEPLYQHAALSGGRRRVRVRAGVTGLDWAQLGGPVGAITAQLDLIADGERRRLPLRREGDEWRAEFPAPGQGRAALPPGQYELEFRVVPAGEAEAAPGTRPAVEGAADRLVARTAFRVEQMEVERRPPTANLPALQTAARQTAGVGGGYYDIEELPEALERLLGNDRRQAVRRRVRYSVVEREPGVLLAVLAATLGFEWAVRKRAGLP